jgi:hypothetical protein
VARRRRGGTPYRRRTLPLLWELGIPAAIAVVPRAVFKVNWKGLFLYGPDMSGALVGIGGFSALAGSSGCSRWIRVANRSLLEVLGPGKALSAPRRT